MDFLNAALVATHVSAGAAWVGLALAFHGFVEPAAERSGAEGERFLLRLLDGPFPAAISMTAIAVLVTGAILYVRVLGVPHALGGAASPQFGIEVGAFAALAALVIACTVTGPSTIRLVRLHRRLSAGETLDRARELALRRALRRLAIGGRAATAAIALALVAMIVGAQQLGPHVP